MGRKRENPEKNHITHPQADLELSHDVCFSCCLCVHGLLSQFWVFCVLGGLKQMGFKKQNSRKKAEMAIFKLVVLSNMHTTLYISFFYSNNTTKFYVV